jgi:hypothetical protein
LRFWEWYREKRRFRFGFAPCSWNHMMIVYEPPFPASSVEQPLATAFSTVTMIRRVGARIRLSVEGMAASRYESLRATRAAGDGAAREIEDPGR